MHIRDVHGNITLEQKRMKFRNNILAIDSEIVAIGMTETSAAPIHSITHFPCTLPTYSSVRHSSVYTLIWSDDVLFQLRILCESRLKLYISRWKRRKIDTMFAEQIDFDLWKRFSMYVRCSRCAHFLSRIFAIE